MKIKFLLAVWCALLCCMASYGQAFDGQPRMRMPKDEFPQMGTRATGEYLYREFPTTGEMKGVVILAAYADVPFSVDSASIHTLLSDRLNADNYTEKVDTSAYSAVEGKKVYLECTIPGSARDYFRAQSFGQFVPSFDVIGPVTLSQKRAYYGANNSYGNDKNTAGMIREACQKAYNDGLTDFKDYDRNGDDIVDFVYVIYAGHDEAQSYIEECIWAKASSISLTLGNGMKISRYACSGELVIDIPVVAGIGTFVHEFSHVLGLPDFYDVTGADSRLTMDVWSVMDYGMYNAGGFVPCAYTAFERYSLDWLPMHTLNDSVTMTIGTTEEEKTGYRVFVKDLSGSDVVEPADTASFYLLETIRKGGWNSYAAAEGLLISEVNYQKSAWTGNQVNAGTHRHSIVPADNVWDFMADEYNPKRHLFGTTNQKFTSTSTPKSVTQLGATMDKPLTNIVYKEGKTTFDFCGGTPVPDGIDNSEFKTQNSELFYDLLGRPVANPTKGIYIVNGKKVVIK